MVIDMSSIPEWVNMEDKHIKPDDGELCVVVPLLSCDYAPTIMQWDSKYERFLNVSEGFALDAKCNIEQWTPRYVESRFVRFWKPLGLPTYVDELVRKRISEWHIERRRAVTVGGDATKEKVIATLRNELRCVRKAELCDRQCAKCELVMEDDDIIAALKYAINAVEKMDHR